MKLTTRLRQGARRVWHSLCASTGRAVLPAYMRVAYSTPRQVVLITVRWQAVVNVWPVDWHVPLSQEPELYGIALRHSSYGAEMIRHAGSFVVNFVPAGWEEAILFCGRTSGRQVDKLRATGLRTEEAAFVDAPRLADALAHLECRVERVIETGDHAFFVGHVAHSVYRADAPRLHHLNAELSAIASTFERT